MEGSQGQQPRGGSIWAEAAADPTIRAIVLYALLALGAVVAAYGAIFAGFASYDDEGTVLVTLNAFAHGQPLYTDIFSPYGPFFFEFFGGLSALSGHAFTTDGSRTVTILVWVAIELRPRPRLPAAQRPAGARPRRDGRRLRRPLRALPRADAPARAARPAALLLRARRRPQPGPAHRAARRDRRRTARRGADDQDQLRRLRDRRRGAGGDAGLRADRPPPLAALAADRARARRADRGHVVGPEGRAGCARSSRSSCSAAARSSPRPGRCSRGAARSRRRSAAGCSPRWRAASRRSSRSSCRSCCWGRASPTSGTAWSCSRSTCATSTPGPFETPGQAIDWGVAALAAALLVTRLRSWASGKPSLWPGLLRGAAGLAIWFTIAKQAPFGLNPSANVDVLPMLLAWVAAVPPLGEPEPPFKRFLRVLLPAVAVLGVLGAYPVPGAQVGVASLMFVPVGALCLADALSALRAWSATRGELGLARFGAAATAGTVALAGMLALGQVYLPAISNTIEWHERTPLPFPGAGQVRLTPEEVEEYEGVYDFLVQQPLHELRRLSEHRQLLPLDRDRAAASPTRPAPGSRRSTKPVRTACSPRCAPRRVPAPSATNRSPAAGSARGRRPTRRSSTTSSKTSKKSAARATSACCCPRKDPDGPHPQARRAPARLDPPGAGDVRLGRLADDRRQGPDASPATTSSITRGW